MYNQLCPAHSLYSSCSSTWKLYKAARIHTEISPSPGPGPTLRTLSNCLVSFPWVNSRLIYNMNRILCPLLCRIMLITFIIAPAGSLSHERDLKVQPGKIEVNIIIIITIK